jgi:hypothetical protein
MYYTGTIRVKQFDGVSILILITLIVNIVVALDGCLINTFNLQNALQSFTTDTHIFVVDNQYNYVINLMNGSTTP